MKLRFLGTRGETKQATRQHRLHTSLEVSYRSARVMIDAGLDWLERLDEVRPRAIVLTHAHPDHAHGLQNGAPCPVHATMDTFQEIRHYPIDRPKLVEPRKPFVLHGMTFEAFPVEHSVTSPSVGYRITAGNVTVFYAGDLIYIHDRDDALAGVHLYIGDGATLSQSFVRKQGKRLIGHTPVKTQIGWCAKAGIPRAIITHCGPELVADHPAAAREVARLGESKGIEATLAVDGMEVVLR